MNQATLITELTDDFTTFEDRDLACTANLTNHADRLIAASGLEPGTLGICVINLPRLPEGCVFCDKEEAELAYASRVGGADWHGLYWDIVEFLHEDSLVFAYAKKTEEEEPPRPKFDPQPESCWQYNDGDKDGSDVFRLVQTPKGQWILINNFGQRWTAPEPTRIGAFGGSEEDFVQVED